MKTFATVAILLAASLSLFAQTDGYDYTVASSKSVDDAVAAISAAAQVDGFKIAGTATLPSPVPAKVVEICDPVGGRKVLDADIKNALLLPCGKFAVYQDAKADMKTKASMLLPSNMMKIYPSKAVDDLAKNLDPRMRKILQAAQ